MLASQLCAAVCFGFSLFLSGHAYLHKSLDFKNTDDDLEIFISRPDIRPPKFKVTRHHSHKSASPGYLFLAPYADLHTRAPSSLYAPGQTGPHIYDAEGNLVWSGAAMFGHRPTFDFKVSTCNDQPCLTFILHEDMSNEDYTGGAGMIMDSSFKIRDSIASTTGRGTMNMHEFTVTEKGTAMYITFSSTMSNVGTSSTFIGDNGFREVDIRSGKVLFDWWALDHVDPIDSLVTRPSGTGAYNSPWDFFHMNSIDKNADGDYLISSRYLNAIFKISGKDGSIIWQLGGTKSSFVLKDFTFSSQHNARFVEESSSYSIISFLNNAADDHTTTARQSSALYIRLDHKNMAATVVKKFNRPDQGLTRLRGNTQTLPNGNTFVSWSENALVSEFDHKGNCLFEGQFASHRFVTYRAYKFNFTSTPSESPKLAAHVYSSAPNNTLTALYVSWNGATNVASWRFLASDRDEHRLTSIGEVKKTGFETVLMVSGWHENIVAEALADDGNVLASSAVVRAVPQTDVTASVAKSHEGPSGASNEKTSHQINAETPAEVFSLKPTQGGRSPSKLTVPDKRTVNYLIIVLSLCCVALCFGLGFAMYRIQTLTRNISLGGSYLPVRSVNLP